MRKIYTLFVLFIFLLLNNSANAQNEKKVNYAEFGIHLRPIFESSTFRTGPIVSETPELQVTLRQKSGFSYGAIIRYGITKGLNFEGGLSITTRNISLSFTDTAFDINATTDFKFLTYELPIQVMTKVPLSDSWFVSASGGFVFDFLPSDVESIDPMGDWDHRTFYKSWIQGAVSANIGVEYATKKSGSIYLGASFHQPFTDLTITRVETRKRIDNRERDHVLFTTIPGAYLTFDIRYFFPESSE